MTEKIIKDAEQKEAEAEVKNFEKELGPFVVAAETTRMAMVFTDAKESGNPIIFANDSFLELTGYTREEVLGQDLNFLMESGAESDAVAHIQSEFQCASDNGVEFRYRRKDGSEFWAAFLVCPVADKEGNIVQHFASFSDISKYKDAQTKSQMLIDELNHRVKNTLSTVQSIVWNALRTSTDADVIREAIESRLHALSRSHDLLTRENWESAGLCDILTDALEPFVVKRGGAERIVLTGKNIRFAPKQALALSIAFNELATNAVKYGAFSNATGSIIVEWKVKEKSGGKRMILTWREKGGPPVAPPSQQGFGSRVIERGLGLELEGDVHLDYPPDGLVCTINIPAPQKTDNE